MNILCLLIILITLNRSSSMPLLLIDLSHTLDPTIPFYPSQTRFNFTQRTAEWTSGDNSFFYSSNSFITSEHIGTHIDAPYHFYLTGWKVDEIPLKHLISVHARLIDVSKQCQKNKNYLITIDDVKKTDLYIPEIDEDTGDDFFFVLIFYTGWTKYWPDQNTYAGENSNIEFPGLSEQLATYLVDAYGKNLVGVGIDTLSTDYGLSKTYPVHQILAKNNKYGLENVALVDSLLQNIDDNFFTLDIIPMKIGNGTGAPCRIIARIDNSRRNSVNWFGFLFFFFILFLIGFFFKVVYDLKYNPNKSF
ncbi:unnamed protein product [Rotaria socialis]|uniref:Kynurenine formamidase n=1 Tax=Rotaria socialis TaxID=392032 RepID=A0A819VCK3_9BILA|nr:unnamed protein product [Rotaria socialis]CAF4139143.1 unnamed protein product [Rotaria socialis]CAF4546811.1 unnamed protein product [Rotaria socialis]